MRCRIHRGCHEIGGNCVELESNGFRIVLDIGLPLKDSTDIQLPNISGLGSPDETMLGIFVSHPHPDHYGLLSRIPHSVPVFIGNAARDIIAVSSFFTQLPTFGDHPHTALVHQQQIKVGPFTVIPYRTDHSAFDSYCLLVECDGKRLFYSGDIRGHGHVPELFRKLIEHPPQNVDLLICEGTQVGRDPNFAYPDEEAVTAGLVEFIDQTTGMCLVWCSSQNIGRLVSAWNAANQTNRRFIVDMYTAEILRAANDVSHPKPGKGGFDVFLPTSQKSKIIREQAFHISNQYYPSRIYPESLSAAASNSVMIFRPSMLNELVRANCLGGATLVTSLWSGYVTNSQEFLDKVDAMKIGRKHIHTSGHATIAELKQFIGAIAAPRVVPIHFEDRDGFSELTEHVEFRNDFEWWEV